MRHQVTNWKRYPDAAEFVYIPCPICKSMGVLTDDQIDQDGCGTIGCHGGTEVRLVGFPLIRAKGTT